MTKIEPVNISGEKWSIGIRNLVSCQNIEWKKKRGFLENQKFSDISMFLIIITIVSAITFIFTH